MHQQILNLYIHNTDETRFCILNKNYETKKYNNNNITRFIPTSYTIYVT